MSRAKVIVVLTQNEADALSSIIVNGWGQGDYRGWGGANPATQHRALAKFEKARQKALAEYRNRPHDISQETARELLNEAQRFSAKYAGEKALTLGTGQASRSLHAFRKLIARAEAELKGR